MESPATVDEVVQKALHAPPDSFSQWQQVAAQFDRLAEASDDGIPMAPCVQLVQCLDAGLSAKSHPLQADAAQRLVLHRLAIRWWQGVFRQFARLPVETHPAIEPEAILLNVLHHALAADEADLAGQTRIALQFYATTVLPSVGDAGRLARLQTELALADKLAHDAASLPKSKPPVGLEKAGYRIQLTAGAFVIVPPPKPPAKFPMQAFCETLESFHHAGPDGDRLVDRLMAALVPHLKEADQLDLLQASFTKIYASAKVGEWRYRLFQCVVVHGFEQTAFESLTGKLFSLPTDDMSEAFHEVVAAVGSVAPEEKKARLLKWLVRELDGAPSRKLREFRTALVEVVVGLKADLAKAKLLSEFLEWDLFKSHESLSRFYDLLQSVYPGLKDEGARIRILRHIASKPFSTPVAASDDYVKFVIEACAHIDDEEGRASILSAVAFSVGGYHPAHRSELLPVLREASEKMKDPKARKQLEEAIAEYLAPRPAV